MRRRRRGGKRREQDRRPSEGWGPSENWRRAFHPPGSQPSLGRRQMNDWPLWEVFVRSKGGMAHRHVGSVHAPDPEIALRHARDTYTRRMEGVSLWVVP